MPNHVTNRISVEDPTVINALLDASSEVDFNRLIPMPSEVEGTTVGSNGFNHDDQRGWYGWSLANWGTKWNAYGTQLDDGNTSVRFDTAWSHPAPVLEALSRQFPTVEIHVEYADEDFGSNVGRYTILNGDVLSLEIPDYGPDSLELASQIRYGLSYAEAKAQGFVWSDDEDEE